MGEDFLLQTFVHYFQALGHRIQSSTELYNGIIIAQFLASAHGSTISTNLIIRDQGIYGAAISNLKLIRSEIVKFEKNYNRMQVNQSQLNIYQIYSDRNEKQLIKLLKKCFIFIAHTPNNSYFIQKILTLPQNQQLIFLKLLKQDTNLLQTSPKQNLQYQNSDIKDNRFYQDVQLIDKLYEMEVQNERLQQEIKKCLADNGQLHEQNLDLIIQIETLKSYSENLKQQLLQANETMMKLQKSNQKEAEKENKNDQNRRQLQKIVNNYKQQVQFMEVQAESSRKKYEQRIKELEIQIKKEKEANERIRQELIYSQNQMQQLIVKFQQSQKQLKIANKLITQLENTAKELHETENALKFEINYKNTQIQELKEMIMNNSSTSIHRDDEHDLARSLIKSPKNLAHEFFSQNTTVSPKSSTSFIVDFQELKSLRAQVKQLQREKQKLNKLKTKNKQLQYEKNKLLKILREYEAARGEENEIIAGCLYEIQMKFMAEKRSFSTDQCSN